MKYPRVLPSIFFALLMLTTVSEAREHHHAGEQHGAGVGAFDYYLLSLSLAPSFCSLTPANQAKAECRDLTEAAFQQTPLTLHGLWPNRARVSVNRQPQDCQGPPFDISSSVQATLQRYMPAGPGLERYEWRKHGACSGLSPDIYFATMAHLAQQMNDALGAPLQSQYDPGQTVSIHDLLAAAGAKDPALAAAIVVNCRSPRGGGGALIDEIRVTLSKDFHPIPAASVGLGQNSGCPAGAGRVPAVVR